MSKSALVVFFVKNLRGNTGLFLLCLAVNPFFRDDETPLWQALLIALAMLAAFLVLAATVAFVNYYYRKYYVKDGNLVFIHGALRKEKTSVPLGKVQSLRTKRGPIYRLLDMRGVSFDTLASASAEIELILDNDDWDALLSRVEAGEDSSEVREEAASPVHETRLTALLILVLRFEKAENGEERDECARFYIDHVDALNNWDLVDLTCYKILGPWLADRSLLYEWAHSGRLWRQRVAIVTCMHPVRRGDFSDAFAIADILLDHPHDLIHKAVGWILREAGKRDEEALTAYLLPRYRRMPRTMLRYAIERFPEQKRQQFLKSQI